MKKDVGEVWGCEGRCGERFEELCWGVGGGEERCGGMGKSGGGVLGCGGGIGVFRHVGKCVGVWGYGEVRV